MRLLFLALPLSLALVFASPANAQDRLARTHYQAGSSYYGQARYEEALREFEEAYRLSSDGRKPALLYNIGMAQERLGHLTEALESFRRYLEASPQAQDREEVSGRLEALQARLDATAIAFEVSEPGATVFVDGENRAVTPLAEPLRVTPGEHELRVEKTGFQTFTLRVTVPAGERISAQASLAAIASEPAPPPPPLRPTQTSSGGHTLTWIAAGVAGAGAIAGGVFGVLALGGMSDANDAAQVSESEYNDRRDSAKLSALLADISFGLAAAGATVAIVLLLTDGGDEEDEPPAVTATPMLWRGGGGLGIAGVLP